MKMIRMYPMKGVNPSLVAKVSVIILIFVTSQCNGYNSAKMKQSDIIRDFHVPKFVIEGETVELHCGMNREDWSDLHSLIWFKDEHMIFSHKPRDAVKTKIYPYDSSIPIDAVTYYFTKNRINGTKLIMMIRNANGNGMCGNYKCEVSLRKYNYNGQNALQTIRKTAMNSRWQHQDMDHITGRRVEHMQVVPDPGAQNELSYPQISDLYGLELSNYTEGGEVSLKCESNKMKPAPSLAWYFKGTDTENTTGEETAVPLTSLIQYPVKIHKIGFEHSTLGIRIKLDDPEQRLLCVALSSPTCTSPITKRGTAVNLATKEFKQYTYLDQPDEPEEEAAPVVVTCPASPSDLEMILNKGLFTFLLSTTVVTFALIFVLLLLVLYYVHRVLIRKKKISCNWLPKKRPNRKISSMSTTSSIIKSHNAMGYCEHCKGPCCTNPVKRQSTLKRGPTIRAGGTMNSIKNPDNFSLSSLSRIGSWKTPFYTPNRTSNYNTPPEQYNNYNNN